MRSSQFCFYGTTFCFGRWGLAGMLKLEVIWDPWYTLLPRISKHKISNAEDRECYSLLALRNMA